MSHGESEPASSSANSAVVVDRVMGGSSSKSEELARWSGDSFGGELPNSDMVVD
jgi:hypothetical protein